MSDLGTLPGHTASAAYRVNRYGHAAGFSGNMLDTAKPVLFHDGSIEEIGALSSTAVGDARDINDAGHALVTTYEPGVGRKNGLWIDGRLEPLPGESVNALNNKDHVVGDDVNYASGYHPYAFLYDGSAITPLNSLLPSNVQLDLQLVWDISDAGHIATAGFWNFNAFTILLVPEKPSTSRSARLSTSSAKYCSA